MCGGTLRQDFYNSNYNGFVIKIRPYYHRFIIEERGTIIEKGRNNELKATMERNEII